MEAVWNTVVQTCHNCRRTIVTFIYWQANRVLPCYNIPLHWSRVVSRCERKHISMSIACENSQSADVCIGCRGRQRFCKVLSEVGSQTDQVQCSAPDAIYLTERCFSGTHTQQAPAIRMYGVPFPKMHSYCHQTVLLCHGIAEWY